MAIDENGRQHHDKGPKGGQFRGVEHAPPEPLDLAAPDLLPVLESAAELQRLVPDAVRVGGTVAALYSGHRLSYDHDHVVADLAERFDLILEALEREGDFVLNRATPGRIILGELGGIETGVRQLIRKRPLEAQRVQLPGGELLTVPTRPEILRVKGFLIVKRNQVRDYLDVAALSATHGTARAGAVLAQIEGWYADDTKPAGDHPVLDQLLRQLADPNPRDTRALADLPRYKGLRSEWARWDAVVEQCRNLADAIASAKEA